MTQNPPNEASTSGQSTPEDPEQLQREIEQTREHLGDTVEALSRKADVKAQAKQRVEQGKDQLRNYGQQAQTQAADVTRQAKERPAPLIAAAGALIALLVLLRIVRR